MNTSNNQQEFILFRRGHRKNLHPNFEKIDDINCEFLYNIKKKFFYVKYQPKFINNSFKGYEKEVISKNVDFIIKTLKEPKC